MLSVRPLVATKWGLSRISPGACVVGRALIRRRAVSVSSARRRRADDTPTALPHRVGGAPQARRRRIRAGGSSGHTLDGIYPTATPQRTPREPTTKKERQIYPRNTLRVVE